MNRTFLVLVFLITGPFFLGACSISSKPTRQMIYASAAIKAAAYVNAERFAPDEFRRAENAFWQAKKFYLLKEFERAESFAKHTQRLAEEAELKAEIKALSSSSY